MNVVVNGLMTNYQKVGSGKNTLIFLHGWGDSSATFSKLIEYLQDDYSILVLDLPGFGGTQTPPSAWGLEDYALFARDWLKKIGVPKTYNLVGHSYGGALSIMATASRQLSPQKLILIGSAGVRNQHRWRRRALWAAAKAAKGPLKLLPNDYQHRIKRTLYGAAGSDVLLLPHMQLTFKRIIKEDVQTAARLIKIPVLLIYGAGDKEAPVSYGRLLQKAIPNSKLEILSAGHFMHQELPDEVAQLMAKFLKDNNV